MFNINLLILKKCRLDLNKYTTSNKTTNLKVKGHFGGVPVLIVPAAVLATAPNDGDLLPSDSNVSGATMNKWESRLFALHF